MADTATTGQAGSKRRDRIDGAGESAIAGRADSLLPPTDRAFAAALHVSNGDATDLPGTGLTPRVLYWRDVLHEGPVPAVGAAELRTIRARFLAQSNVGEQARLLRTFEERDRTLESNQDGEYVLWFEADLYDQLQIIQILARLAELGVPAERITMICIGEHPEIARFGGLGQLTAAQLRELPATNASIRLVPGALQLAGEAWDALRATTPNRLGTIAAARSVELRFLGEAFDRLSREYPSTRDGLSLTERRVLAAVAAGTSGGRSGGARDSGDAPGTGDGTPATGDGAPDADTVFYRAIARETRPYLGDSWCYAAMDRMATCDQPLLAVEPAGQPVDRHTRLRLTGTGRRVLAGEADHVTLNGVDRWIGGVQLRGHRVRWRWDDGIEAIVERPPPAG